MKMMRMTWSRWWLRWNTIPYRRTKTHIWDKVLMGIWVHPGMMIGQMMITGMRMVGDYQSHRNHNNHGVHPNSHKHFIPYMGFCASIWDSVRHHCHHHYHHYDHLKWTVKQQRRRQKNLWANFKRLGWMDISILRHGPALDGRQTWQTTARKPTMASSTGR